MNTQIFELIQEQNGFRGLVWTEEDKKEFADLIVRECMKCSTWVGEVNNNPVELIHTAHAINKRISKLFGVEE